MTNDKTEYEAGNFTVKLNDDGTASIYALDAHLYTVYPDLGINLHKCLKDLQGELEQLIDETELVT